MKIISILILAFVFLTIDANAQRVRVRGHYSPKRGTYVMPHYRTTPDHSRLNNWSSRGNLNPFTGRRGTTDPCKVRIRR